ncbi:MAG: Gfo/Idh/MocA family oxidoreductase [Firmicutes bacterium]|nr:Gfo/Idh/MocA family oxidoreductase [Bacillota bacterium]
MKNGKLGYAVVGLGIGRAHADAAAGAKDAELVAVCDLIKSKLDAEAEKYPYIKTFESFDEMIKDDEIDIVSICLPSSMHTEFAVRAIEAGKNVLVEKPIDITADAALKIEAARRKYGVKVGVVHQNRKNACMAPIHDAVASGRLGKLFLGQFAVKWYREESYYKGWHGTWEYDGGGSLMNQAVHTVDLMQWLMGEVTSVRAETKIVNHSIETEDLSASLLTFKSGALGLFTSTTCAYPGISTDIQLYGTKGTIEADADILKTWKLADSEDEDAEEEEMLAKYGHGNGYAATLDKTLVTGHAAIVEDMIAAVKDNRDPLILPTEAIKSVRIVNAIYEAARTGETIKL